MGLLWVLVGKNICIYYTYVYINSIHMIMLRGPVPFFGQKGTTGLPSLGSGLRGFCS